MNTMKSEPERYASAWTKFRLLMWKNFLQQWRHPIQTAVELLLPVATMTLILILRWQIQPEPRDMSTYPPLPAYTLNYSAPVLGGMNITRMSIAYSPASPALEDVLRMAMANLILANARDFLPIIIDNITNNPNIDLPPDFNPPDLIPPDFNSTIIADILSRFINVTAYESSQHLKGLYIKEETTRYVIAAVEFNDELFGATVLPDNITYALRFPERPRLNQFYARGGRFWRTDAIFPIFEMPGPRFPWSWEGGNDPGYVNEMFIALQHSISTELVSRVTGLDLRSFRVNIQRYPHPQYVQDFAVNILQMMFPMFLMLSFSYTAINIVRAITVEKELQLKETMKIMGLPTWLHWTAWFWKQFLFLLFTAILIVILLKINWFTNEAGLDDSAVFIHTPWTVLFFFMMIYLACMIFFSFMLSGLFSKGSTASLLTGVLWFLSYVPSILLIMDVDMSTAVQVVTCLSINTAMSYGFQLMLARESTGGLQWGEFMLTPSTESSRFVFGHVVIMLVVDCVIYMLIALYLEQVMPGPFGTPKPWYFPFTKQFWLPNTKSATGIVLLDENHSEEDVIKEKDPIGLEVGVRMQNLTKVFAGNIAVNHLSLDIYDDQITVLLGHNGAGKSTTISMLTGNLEITQGSVMVAGYDMAKQISSARAHIGLCPQHNVLFNELTVKEHLEFFARLKGFKGKELKEDIDTLIEKLELEEKRNYQSNGLSGGQKRRLCVGIALSGAAKVVLLDEPTSGMDPASRRGLWELLQKEKIGRSMILTTHFMDEADILGDRVAIMANGKLQCVGSPYFLKRHYGVGYTLVVVKDVDFDSERCTALINEYIPGSEIKEDRGTEVTYSLLNEFSYTFEELLNKLEENASTINFKNYGLVATTLEDVFMSVGSDLAPVSTDLDDAATIVTDSTSEEVFRQEMESSLEQLDKETAAVTGFDLLLHHVWAIWFKLGLVWIRSWWLIILQFAAPVFIINLTLGIVYYVMSMRPTVRKRLLTLTEGYSRTETLLNYNGTSTSTLGALAFAAYELMFESSGVDNMDLTVTADPINEYYVNRTNDTVAMGTLRHQMLIGSTFSEDTATAWFSNFGYHDVAVSLAAVHSALMKIVNPAAELIVYNHPLEATYDDQRDMQTMITMLSMQLASGVGSSVAIVTAVFVMFYIKERVSGAKLLQKAASVQPAVLWGSASIFDWMWFNVICLTIIISCVAFSVIGLSSFSEVGRLYLCIMVYGAAVMPLTYLISLVFKGPALGFVAFYFLNVLFGNMSAQIVESLSSPELDTQEVADILDVILQFFPLYSLVTSVRLLNQIGLREHVCLQMCDMWQAAQPSFECTMEALCREEPNCCVEENPYFRWETPGVLRYIICTLFSCVVLWILLMIIEYRIFQKLFTFTKKPPPIDTSTLDEDVAKEAERALHVGRTDHKQEALFTTGLSKYYGKNLAVDQVSFCVSDGECFGLLGVNGAGKTSTFKMLMGDESISSGEAYVSGYSVQRNLNRVHENIGYCPQFDALFPELTGRETLRIFLLMRGRRTPSPDVLAHKLGFSKHIDKRVSQYSGGTKRKLNTAVALLGQTRLIFVDEPTTGVDPAAKRHVWRAIRNVQNNGRGVVLTSHSMEESEALCSRLTIMVNGRFQCIGTPQHLKNKFSRGFTLTIKLKSEETDRSTRSLNRQLSVVSMSTMAVKDYVKSSFNDPKIMEEYQGMLTYYLPDRSIPWSRMFGIMERAKRDLEVDDYTISQASLEQIFLQFTKYQGLKYTQIAEEIPPPTIEVIS